MDKGNGWELWKLRRQDTPCGAPVWSTERLVSRHDACDAAITACKAIERPGLKDHTYAVLDAEDGYTLYETGFAG